jgi:methionine transaminase
MIPNKLPQIETSIFSVMSSLAKVHDAINLSQGFPDFECDPELIREVDEAMKAGANQYAPMPGDLGLRKAISDKCNSLYKKQYDPNSEITITAGATQAIFTALACTISQGDEVILFAPAYDCYEPTIQLFGGVVKYVQLRPPSFHPDWTEVKSKITAATKMIIINSPHNPTGTLFSEKDMLELEQIVVENDLLLLSDEVYEHIIFDGEEHYSAMRFPHLADRSFITASFGKTFHATGWKLGYCLAPEMMMEKFRKIHQFNVFCVNHPMQKAIAAYMKDPAHYLSLANFYQSKRDYFISQMSGSRFKIIPAKGTYFQLLDFSEISDEGDVAFAKRLTKDLGVATIPTSVFNKNNEDFQQLRVCFAKQENTLYSACQRLKSL